MNWSAPGPERITNFWWKWARSLQEGVVNTSQAMFQGAQEYPLWFSGGKTALIPKPGEFASDNQRPITCLNHISRIPKRNSLRKRFEIRSGKKSYWGPDGIWKSQQIRLFAWLKEWRSCPLNVITGMFELYEQLLPTKLYHSQKTRTIPVNDVQCRLCNKVPESVAHVLSGCSALVQNKYLARHNAALKILFFEILRDLGLLEEVPPWYSPVEPRPTYKSRDACKHSGIYQYMRCKLR